MSSVVSTDHLDLLVTAGFSFGLITNPSAKAFGRIDRFFAARSVNEVGRILQQQNQANLDWLAQHGRLRLADRGRQSVYTHTAVPSHQIVPIEVLKACQAYEHSCQSSPTWSGSRARQYITALTVATVRRLPGYPEAPWEWTRPPNRSGTPIAYGNSWRPAIDGLLWVREDELVDRWNTARLVVVTVDVVTTLPVLPSRPALFVLARQEIPDETWSAVESLAPESIVFYPVAEPWLTERLRPEVADLSEVRP